MKRLWVYVIISLIIHILIISIPVKQGYFFGKRLKFFKKREKPTMVKLIEIPEEKPEKRKVKPPKHPKYLSRYTHRTKKEIIPKTIPRVGKTVPLPSKPEKESKVAFKKPKKGSKGKVAPEKSEEGYKLPPLEKLLPNPEKLAGSQKPAPIKGNRLEREGSTIDIGEIGSEERKILSLNTMEFKYLSYFLSIKRKIYLMWDYPKEAALMGMEGKLKIRFTIGKDGSLKELKLVKSSGYRILDEEALNAIKYAAPFNPIPDRFGQDHITILATFEYVLVR